MENTSGERDPLRTILIQALDWQSAHLSIEDVLARFGPESYGQRVYGLPYSPWQLVEHMRLTQRDILDFCRDPDYEEPRWPDDYWPAEVAPASPSAWDTALADFKADLESMKQLITDPAIDLFDKIPHGDGQTYIREALLVVDHNAYHLGQLVVLWRLISKRD